MPRAMRVEYPGAIYHPPPPGFGETGVMDRGDRREDIFVNDVDRQDLIKTLAEACEKTGWQVHAYCLMRNPLEDEEALKALRRGWCLGSQEFRQRMLELMEGKLGDNHCGELHRETAEQKANRIIGEELARRSWQESDLAGRHRIDPGKLAIAARLRKETTLPVKWIAARVKIGTTKGAKSVLHRLAHAATARHNESCAQLEFQSTV